MGGRGDLTVSDVAAELRISRDHVVDLIESGELHGYDASAPGARRRSLRVPREALDAFKRHRQSRPAQRRRRRRRASGDVKEIV